MPSNHLKIVNQFLSDRKEPMDLPESGFPFVTISRQTGAGSHLLCDTLMADFKKQDCDIFRGWHVFDQLICEAIAKDPKLSESLENLVKEHYESELEALMDGLIAGISSSYTLYKKTFQVITMLAVVGKVIIVGRAANRVTESFKTGVHMHLVAPEEQRIATTMERLKLDRKAAIKAMRIKERERHRLAKTFFGCDVEDPLIYDATWNTGKASMEEISSSIIQMIRMRSCQETT